MILRNQKFAIYFSVDFIFHFHGIIHKRGAVFKFSYDWNISIFKCNTSIKARSIFYFFHSTFPYFLNVWCYMPVFVFVIVCYSAIIFEASIVHSATSLYQLNTENAFLSVSCQFQVFKTQWSPPVAIIYEPISVYRTI